MPLNRDATSRLWLVALLALAALALPSVAAARTRAPTAPGSLTATAGVGSVTLNWKASSGSGIAGYRVYRTTTGTWPSTALASTNASTLTYANTGLAANTTYSYRVTAYNTSGQVSSPSNTASATPAAAPAPPPASPPSSSYRDLIAGTSGLISYWRLDDAAGPTAADVTGRNPATYTGGFTLGGPGALAGDPDTAARFDGASGYASAPNSASLAVGDTFSIEAWVKRGSTGTAANQVVAAKQNGSFVLMFDSSDRLVLRRSNVGDVVASTAPLTDTSGWHYVAATKSGSAVHLYIDGQDVTGPSTSQTMADNTLPFVIGESSGGAYFNGSIDEVALYAGALSASQLSAHYQAGLSASSGSGSDPVIAAAGDIACATTDSRYNAGAGIGTACEQQLTSNLIVNAGLSAVLPLGDTQYDSGTLAEFQGSYDPTWGRVKSITHPAVGNHEYTVGGASGYFDYFNGLGVAGGPAGDRSKGYYSYDIGSWHLIALNSECAEVGGCGSGSPQEQWLRADLAAHPAACTLAYWHRPLFNSSFTGAALDMTTAWQDLYAAGADVVLNGHAHDYERFAPQTPDGALDNSRGIREFIAGTGGEDHHAVVSPIANSEVHDGTTFGVLRMTLHPNGYDWQFVPVVGGAAVDSGSASCH